MTVDDVGYPVPAWAREPGPREPGKRGGAIAIGVVLLLLFGVGAYQVLRTKGAPRGYPSKWDSRVVPYEQFVERAWGHSFKHPIFVDFLSDSAFRKRIGSDNESGESSLNTTTIEMRAMGLLDGAFDYRQAASALRTESVVRLYDFATRRISVRGQTLDLAGQTTLVHELTHALQDQYFDISGQSQEIDQAEVDAQNALRDVVEGDAVRIENKFIASLSVADRAKERSEEKALSAAGSAAAAKVPQMLEATELAPYVLGPDFADYFIDASGSGEIDGALTQPPTAEAQVLQPWRYISSQRSYVSEPDDSSPGKTFDYGTLGALTWYLMLGDKLGPAAAMRAVEGWDGDHYVAYRTGSQSCLQLTYQADSAANLTAMLDALTTWIKAVPGHDAKVTLDSTRTTGLTLRTCDPGPNGQHVVKNQVINSLRVAEARLAIAAELVKSGASSTEAGCAATKIAETLTLKQLDASSLSSAEKALVRNAEKACG